MNPLYWPPNSVDSSRKRYDLVWRFHKGQNLKDDENRETLSKDLLSLFQLLTLPGISIFMEAVK